MSAWKEFEKEWAKFLMDTYGDLAYFQHMGEEDSTVPDILVKTNTGKTFYIEAKKCPAQCGQFVLLPDDKTRTFIYSDKNDTPINEFAKTIMRFMNRYYNDFKNAGTAGKTIVFDNMEEVFTNWIINTYGNKGVELFGTNDHVMFPLNDFHKYFNVTGTYRIKRSGSSKVGNSNMKGVIDYIQSNFGLNTYRKTDGGSLFYVTNKNMHNRRFDVGAYEYMFSYRDNEFEIRKLSNTYNANVIFSITLKYDAPSGMTKQEIIKFLK